MLRFTKWSAVRRQSARVGALILCFGAMLAIQAPAVRSQAGAPKLATVLGDLVQSVQQDRGRVTWSALVKPLAMASMPRSVQDAASSQRLRVDANGTVQVYILLAAVTDDIVARLTSAGARVEVIDVAGRRVQARVPLRSLQRIAELPFVGFIRLPSYARHQTGSVESDGDAIHSGPIARSQFGVDGTGVKVGVISDGIKGILATKCEKCRGTAGGPIASGDLPDSEGSRRNGKLVTTQGGIIGQSYRSDEDLEATSSFFSPCAFRGAGAEGTALLEIVHDVAPGAQLSFANADTSLAFNAAVNALAAENDVVVDDLGFPGEPANGQSSVSRNTAAALNNPGNRIRAYITSAGNAATDHYFGAYVDSGRDGRTISGIASSGRLHLFQRTDETTDVLGLGDQPYDVISLPRNGEVVIVLTWNDPAGQSANNYDLFLIDDDTGEVVARSTDVQRGAQDPLEAIDFLNRGNSGLFRIVVQNVSDQAAGRELNLFSFQPQCAVDGPQRLVSGRHELHNYNTASRSLLAQSDAGGSPVSAISVAAVCSATPNALAVFANSDAPSESCNDTGHSTIQFFSSRGPTLDGRLKPDIAAIDGVAITGAGRFPSTFFGTSAAAPHVAGIAALALHAAPCLASGGVDPVMGRTTLRDLIVGSADPIGGSVPNHTFGFGLANAVRSVERALAACPGSTPAPPSPPPSPPSPPSPSPGAGGPTTSTITQLSGPTTIQDGQQLWKFQSVESPNWDTPRWGTDTHRFNVTVVPGSGPLPVTLMLHGAGGPNGPKEPQQFIDTLTPGIYINPVEVWYLNGEPDPLTGSTRGELWWMGMPDGNGIFQPFEADRVVRYVQWVLTQTSKWNPDPNRVYVLGGSMGGGGAQKIALLYPNVFAAGVAVTGWIDLNAWVNGSYCKPGMRWRTTNGPLCTDMHDSIYLIRNPQGRRVPLFLTWGSNDTLINPARYPELIAALESAQHGYMAEWRTSEHGYFQIAGDPHLQYRLNVAPTIGPPTGSNPTAPSGTRTNLR
jgi:predicted esterase